MYLPFLSHENITDTVRKLDYKVWSQCLPIVQDRAIYFLLKFQEFCDIEHTDEELKKMEGDILKEFINDIDKNLSILFKRFNESQKQSAFQLTKSDVHLIISTLKELPHSKYYKHQLNFPN